jgi:hypothetical protein
MRVYPKVSQLATWSENCKWHSCIAILWVSLVSSATITLCNASEWVFFGVVHFIINSVWKLLDTSLYSTKITIIIWEPLHLTVNSKFTFGVFQNSSSQHWSPPPPKKKKKKKVTCRS